MENIKYKVCSTCETKKELNAEYWHRQKGSKDGYRSQCKECRKITSKEYVAKNKEKITRYREQYYENNKEYFSEYRKQYRAKNKEYFSEYQKQYLQSEQGRKNHARAKQNRKARINSLPNTLTIEQYDENLDHFDYKCAYCECELTPDNHHMEHVYPISRGVYGTTKENCIPSCESCNSSKHAKTLAEWYVWTEDYSFERLLKIHEITSGGKEWIVSNN